MVIGDIPSHLNLSMKQARSAAWASARLNVWQGAVRSGKTVSSEVAWLKYVTLEAPPGDLLMVGKTERTLKRNIIMPLLDIAGSACVYKQGEGELYIMGRRCYIVGANDERSENKIRGMTCAGAYGDEITLWPESFFQMLLSRMSVAGARFFGTTNPDSPAHWLKTKYIDRFDTLNGDDDAHKGLRVFHFRLEDNETLDHAYVEQLKREYTGLWYRRYILGDWVAAEGAVYDMFDTDKHLVNEMPQLSRHFMAADYGTVNPTTLAYMSLGVDGVWYIHHEYRHDSLSAMHQKTDAEYSADVQAHIREARVQPETIFIDPSAASFQLQLWRDFRRQAEFMNVHIVDADNTVLDGIRDMGSMLAAGLLKIHRPSVTSKMIDEIIGYSWDDKAQRRGEDKPIKMADHGPDMIRYAVRGTKRYWRRSLLSVA